MFCYNIIQHNIIQYNCKGSVLVEGGNLGDPLALPRVWGLVFRAFRMLGNVEERSEKTVIRTPHDRMSDVCEGGRLI